MPTLESPGGWGIEAQESQSSSDLAIGPGPSDAPVEMGPAPSSSPAWLAILAAGTLVPILVIAGVSMARVLDANARPVQRTNASRHQPAVLAPSSAAASGSSPSGPSHPEWVDKLSAATCDNPCVGGSACAMTGNKACASRFTCIPGATDDVVDALMPLSLRLSALIDQNSATDLCKAELEVCFVPASTQSSTCIPLSDPCSHAARSALTVPIMASDLISGGIVVSVRKSTLLKTELATASVRYGIPIRRVGMCSGFKAGGFVNRASSHVRSITFFVEPRFGD